MDQEIIQLLKKYINNRCTATELEQVRQLLASGAHEEEWNAVLQQEAVNDMADESEVKDFDSDSVLHRINTTITPARRISSGWWMGIAASLFLVLSAGYLFWKKQAQPVNNLPLLSVVTAAGQQKKITLTDGSEITLNCGSTLRYTAQFTGPKREVYLKGEAFFNVKHDTQHPFFVHTGRLQVQVLGTSFNVRSYPSDRRATVSVATGKVGVNGTKAPGTYMLLPGDLLSYNNNNTFTKGKTSLDDLLGWQKGILIFHLETIQEIAPVLERYYGVTIHVNTDHVPQKQVTASFTRKTLPQILEILSQTADFNYAIDKNEVQIK